jgi:uncharacterized membrane protein (TIGR02234 family)
VSVPDDIPPRAEARAPASGLTSEGAQRLSEEGAGRGPGRAAASAASTVSGGGRREYGYALLAGAAGSVLILLAVRQRWAQAVFAEPKPLGSQTINVSGSDLVPLAGALALAALACLAAVIATRGVGRRVTGTLLALFGAGAGAAVTVSVKAATVISVAASKVASGESAAISGSAGSTTSGSSSSSSYVVSGSAGHAIMTGTVLAGALLIFRAGLFTALRGPDWPVMSARYDGPAARDGRGRGRGRSRPLDSATMWESLNGGEDPTDDELAAGGSLPADQAGDGPAGEAPAPRERKTNA